ncbi:MAG: metal-sensitive transcriptional regulator [Thermomicrobiales bacterium]
MIEDVNDAVESEGHPSYEVDKAKILARLRRIAGQIRGVQRMVEDDKYCVDILTQLSAVIAATRQTGLVVLENHGAAAWSAEIMGKTRKRSSAS